MIRIAGLGVLLLLAQSLHLSAEEADSSRVHTLLGVTIYSYKSLKTEEEKKSTKSFTDYARIRTDAYLMDQGGSGLKTISYHGLPAAYTEIRWKQMSLNSALNGVKDVWLLPSVLFEGSRFEQQINGGLGLDLQSRDRENKSTNLLCKLSYSSLNNMQSGFRFQWMEKKLTAYAGLYHSMEKNNYFVEYPYEFSSLRIKQEHNDAQQFHLNSGIRFALDRKQKHFASMDMWYYRAMRELPVGYLFGIHTARQEDEGKLLSFQLSSRLPKWEWNQSISFKQERLDYADSSIRLQSHSLCNSYRFGSELNNEGVGLIQFKSGYSVQVDDAMLSNYKCRQVRQELFAGLEAKRNLHQFNGGLKLKISDRQFSYPLPYFQWNADRLFRDGVWSFLAAASMDQRFPALNDLYWQPGGNPNLKSETNFFSEAQIRYLKSSIGIGLSANVFALYQIDRIQWLSTANGYWEAQNFHSVLSSGIRIVGRWEGGDKWKKGIELDYCFNPVMDLTSGGALLYAPKNKLYGKAHLQYQGYSLMPEYQYCSRIPLSNDGSYSLRSIHLLHVQLAKEIKGVKIHMQFRNLFNQNYEYQAGHPIAGFHVEGGLDVNIYQL